MKRSPRKPSQPPLAETWGAALRTRREALGLTQLELATRAGVAQQALSFYESGARIPLDGIKIRLAYCLDQTPAELFAWPAA